MTWKQIGKPRGDDTDMDMRTTRLQFKYILRQCRMDKDMIRADALARSLHCKHTTSFWKGVKSMRVNDVLLATKVGDPVGDANVSKLWQDHFSTLLNSVQNNGSKTYVSESIKHGLAHADTVVITAPIVRECFKSIKLGKAAGLDGLAMNILSIHTILFVFNSRYYLLAC